MKSANGSYPLEIRETLTKKCPDLPAELCKEPQHPARNALDEEAFSTPRRCGKHSGRALSAHRHEEETGNEPQSFVPQKGKRRR